VPDNIPAPPSLKNIFKALNNDLNKISNNNNYNLTLWAKQGVLLLNTSLSVEANKANSHAKIGWEIFTDEIIKNLNHKKENLVFLLWGKPAQEKQKLIDKNKHLILISSHPSPLSAYRGFLNCGHFSKTNNYLLNKNIKQINWI